MVFACICVFGADKWPKLSSHIGGGGIGYGKKAQEIVVVDRETEK